MRSEPISSSEKKFFSFLSYQAIIDQPKPKIGQGSPDLVVTLGPLNEALLRMGIA
jgi:hypothetical protein